MTPQLCLGTAQFGLAYGITNTNGQVSETEVGELLIEANKAGIGWLDTAQAYGNAESVLGRQLPNAHGFTSSASFLPNLNRCSPRSMWRPGTRPSRSTSASE